MRTRVRRRGVPGLARRDAKRWGCLDGLTLSWQKSINIPASPGVARRRPTPGDAGKDLIVEFEC